MCIYHKQVELDLLKTNITHFKLLLLLVAFKPQEQGSMLGTAADMGADSAGRKMGERRSSKTS